MSMLDEIEKFMNGTGISYNYRIVNLGGKSLYIEGIKSVVYFGDEEMSFQLKNKLLIVSGNQLSVKYLDKTSCVINGEIRVVETK